MERMIWLIKYNVYYSYLNGFQFLGVIFASYYIRP